MSGDTTAVFVHESRFPLRILKHLARAGPAGIGSQIKRLDPLFRYEANAEEGSSAASTSYTSSISSRGNGASGDARELSEQAKGKRPATSTTVGTKGNMHDEGFNHKSAMEHDKLHKSEILTFESPIEGLVMEWCAPEGELLRDPYQPVLRILEPCKHPVQLGGLCAVCGKDLTSVDYTGFRETSRASISMSHDTANLTVSLEEAARLEKQTTSRLRKERKLSLIVDLDQTIIHATVDPTVGDWMFDEKNPNYPVLRDVQRFKLLNEEGKEEGCWYYVKPRPSLPQFLQEASKIYELHVYTMGTRQYAENVCRIIDPDGRMFANRILSRDESGSMVRKSLERLFPVDQSMVVIIDDRADIWDWSPHLVKVVPYDFFVGIGDINSAFLPKQTSALASVPKDVADAAAPSLATTDNAKGSVTLAAVTDENAAITEQLETLDHQIIDKPLARMQEEKSAALHEALDHVKQESEQYPSSRPSTAAPAPSSGSEENRTKDSAASAPTGNSSSTPLRDARLAVAADNDDDLASDSSDSDTEDEDVDDDRHKNTSPSVATGQPSSPVVERDAGISSANGTVPTTKDDSAENHSSTPGSFDSASIPPEEEAVLHDDDTELERVLELLSEIHRRYYGSADVPSTSGVQVIIPRMKAEVLQGCNLVFSGVIPLDKEPETSEIWQLAEQFGATCTRDLSRRTTHVIAALKGTSKVNSAQRRRDVSVVTLSWLLTSVNLWRRQPESVYALEPSSPRTHSDGASVHADDIPSPRSGTSDQVADPKGDPEFNAIDWGDAEAEIQAFLDETDDEESRVESSAEDGGDGQASGAEDSGSTIAERKKRSLSSSGRSSGDNTVGSPLAKRRRVAAARAGQSKLKLSESAAAVEDGSLDESEDGEDGEDEDLDDFAKALEGELM